MIKHPSSLRGFTLLEILVALIIFGIMSTMAYRGLSSVLQSRDHLTQENRKWRAIALAFTRFENDLSQIVNRPARQASSTQSLAFYARPQAPNDSEPVLAFTRLGHAGQDNALGGPIRCAYRLRQNTLEQLIWNNPEADMRQPPYTIPLLNEVKRLELRYLDQSGNWHNNWPLAGINKAIPVAVEITLELQNQERVKRLIEVPAS